MAEALKNLDLARADNNLRAISYWEGYRDALEAAGYKHE